MKAALLHRGSDAGHTTEFQGIPVVVEWLPGSTRTGTGKDGKPWSRLMLCTYGRVPGTHAKGDNEGLDVYIGPYPTAPNAWVIDQLDDDGSFDEPKCMLGFPSKDAAILLYLKHYPAGWESHIGDVKEVTVTHLRELIEEERGEKVEGSHRFITLAECLEAFNTRVLPSPLFQRAIKDSGIDKPWEDFSHAERNAVCTLYHHLEYGD